VQVESQQTPSTQWADPHSVSAPHVAPFGLRPDWQVPLPSQYWVPLQAGLEFAS
jgi:flagellar assembly factor FliW